MPRGDNLTAAMRARGAAVRKARGQWPPPVTPEQRRQWGRLGGLRAAESRRQAAIARVAQSMLSTMREALERYKPTDRYYFALALAKAWRLGYQQGLQTGHQQRRVAARREAL